MKVADVQNSLLAPCRSNDYSLLDGDNAAFRAHLAFWAGLNAHDALVANKNLILILTQKIERLQNFHQQWTVNRAVNACPHTSSRLAPVKRTFS
jgi:hypothetical protein